MECDASLSMIWVKPTLALSNKLWQLVYQNQPPNRSKNLKWASTLPFSIFQALLNLRNLSLKRFRLSSNLKLQLPPLPVPVASATSKHLMLSPRKRLSTEIYLCIVSTLVFKSTRKRTKCSRRRWPRRSTWRAFSNQKSTTWTSILLKFLAWRSSKTCQTTTPHKMCRTRPTSREATSTETPRPMSFSLTECSNNWRRERSHKIVELSMLMLKGSRQCISITMISNSTSSSRLSPSRWSTLKCTRVDTRPVSTWTSNHKLLILWR